MSRVPKTEALDKIGKAPDARTVRAFWNKSLPREVVAVKEDISEALSVLDDEATTPGDVASMRESLRALSDAKKRLKRLASDVKRGLAGTPDYQDYLEMQIEEALGDVRARIAALRQGPSMTRELKIARKVTQEPPRALKVDQRIDMLSNAKDRLAGLETELRQDGDLLSKKVDKKKLFIDLAQTQADISGRLKYLKDVRDNSHFVVKKLYKAKELDVQTALNVLDKNIAAPNANVQFLNIARQMFADRLQKVKDVGGQDDSSRLEPNPNKILGPSTVPDPKYAAQLEQELRKDFKGALENRPLADPNINEYEYMRIALKVALALGNVPLDSVALKTQMRDSHVEARNAQTWNPIKRKVLYRTDGREVEADSTILPASQLKNGHVFDDMNGKGVCAHDTKNYEHATTLASTELKVEGKVVYSALRHGINSARGISPSALEEMPDDELKAMIQETLDPAEWEMNANQPDEDATAQRIKNDKAYRKQCSKLMKAQANINRSKDIVTAALVKDRKRLQEAIALAKQGKPYPLNLTSTCLVTAGFGGEEKMLEDQVQAWGDLSQQGMDLDVKDDNGVPVKVRLDVKVNAFNFGVNIPAFAPAELGGTAGQAVVSGLEGAMRGLGVPVDLAGSPKDLKFGWIKSDQINAAPMANLIGSPKDRKNGFGGQVNAWLQAKAKERAALDPAGQAELDEEVEIVTELAKQIAKIWDTGAYKDQGTEPYKMVSRLSVLAFKLGQEPVFNCKSGKDRTSQLDAEAKLLATRIKIDKAVPAPDPARSEQDRQNLLDMALNSGCLELQQLNTGYMGYKLQLSSLDKTLGADKKDHLANAQHTDRHSAEAKIKPDEPRKS